MRKRELARAVAARLEARGLSGDLVELVIQATMDHLSDELARTGRLEYRDLGTFSVETYKARSIHNPKTGAIIQLPARLGVSFKPGLRLMSKLPPIEQPAVQAESASVETQVPAPRPIEGPAWVRLRPSPFIPEGKEFGPLFHQAIAMAAGRLVRLKGDRGLLDIDGYRYEFVDCRSKLHKARTPLVKFQEQVLTFVFWPTVTAAAIAEHAPDDPPIVSMSGLRPILHDPGLVQVVGLVDLVAEDHVRIAIHTRTGVVVYVLMLGRYTGTAGELIQAFGHLSEGAIQLESWHVLQPEPAPPGFEPKVKVEPNAPPARLHNAWVRYQPTPFFAEVGQLAAWRPQAIGMARGRVVEAATPDAPGVIAIDGHPYPFIDRRSPHLKERLSSAAMLDREVMGTFGANFTSRDPDNQSLRPTLQLLSLRTSVQDQGAVQVLGQVEAIHEDRVRFVIHHEGAFYYTSMRGRYTGEVGDPVQALGRLVAGEIHLERWHVLQLEPPIAAQDEPT